MDKEKEFQKELPYAYWLHNIKGVGNKGIRKLLRKAKLPSMLYGMSEKQMIKMYIEGEACLTRKAIEYIQESKKVWDLKEEYSRLQAQGVSFYPEFHPAYPEHLKRISSSPWAIYVIGRLPDENKLTIAVIGARECSAYGICMAKELGKKLAAYGVQVISGMAKGIDSMSQRAALEENGDVFSVLGNGVDICYPTASRWVYEQVKQNGGIISEYPLKTEPRPGNFPARNRIISGLADAVVVVEAKEKSGTLITVNMALEQGKEVFAVPGRVTDGLSRGCNRLIQDGAGVFVSVEEMLEELLKKDFSCRSRVGMLSVSTDVEKHVKTKEEANGYFHASDNSLLEQRILNKVDFYPKTLQKIYDEVNEKETKENRITPAILMEILLRLEETDKIQTIGDNYMLKT